MKFEFKDHFTSIRLFVILGLVCAVAMVVIPPALANGVGLVWLNPADVDIDPGGSANVTIQLSDVTNVYGAQVSLSFDPAVLEVVDADLVTPGVQITAGTCPAPDFVVTNSADNGTGTIDFASISFLPTPACDGGDIATIEFSCVTTGAVSDVTFTDSLISDPDGFEILANTQNGTVHCRSTPTELLTNGEFEVFVPNSWKGVNLTGSDGPDCTTSASGSCSAKIVGDGTVKQITYVGVVSGSAGDELTLNLWNRTDAAGGPFFAKAVVIYNDMTQEDFKILPTKGTHGWLEFSANLTAAKNYNRVRIFLLYGAGSGTVWFDDVSLIASPSMTEMLNGGDFEITVPNGWKGVNLTGTDGPDCTTSASGSCSATMLGNGTVKQITFVRPVSGSAGDDFTFGLWNRTDAAGGPFFAKVVLIYTDMTQAEWKILPTKGTHGWLEFETDFTAAKNYNRIRIFLLYGAGSGTVWLDDVSLTQY